MSGYWGFMICAAMTGLEVFMFALTGSPWSIASGIFCGLMTIYCLVMAAKS